jgi:hypothetical protein
MPLIVEITRGQTCAVLRIESASAEAPWLIIKNLDQDERNARGSYRTISTTIYGQQFDEGAARPRTIGLSGP